MFQKIQTKKVKFYKIILSYYSIEEAIETEVN